MKNTQFFKRLLSGLFLLPIIIYIVIEGSLLFNLFLFLCLVLTFYEWHFLSIKKNYYYFGYIYLIFSFVSAYKIRYINDDESFYFLLILLICISTDLGGYICGKLFKGPKLTKFSPNKTISGMIGSYIISMTVSLIFLSKYDQSYFNVFDINIIFIILLISTVSQVGDIIISVFKRIKNIKDTGKIIPGHGGILDRIDGMIFVFPFTYILFLVGAFK
tara:strand:+ start:438 stop:1088 length:651 start_codon:yes stop_codon:yes gene_type:complete